MEKDLKLADRPLEVFESKQICPWPESEQRGGGVDRPIPAGLVAGGVGEGSREVHQVRAHL